MSQLSDIDMINHLPGGLPLTKKVYNVFRNLGGGQLRSKMSAIWVQIRVAKLYAKSVHHCICEVRTQLAGGHKITQIQLVTCYQKIKKSYQKIKKKAAKSGQL